MPGCCHKESLALKIVVQVALEITDPFCLSLPQSHLIRHHLVTQIKCGEAAAAEFTAARIYGKTLIPNLCRHTHYLRETGQACCRVYGGDYVAIIYPQYSNFQP